MSIIPSNLAEDKRGMTEKARRAGSRARPPSVTGRTDARVPVPEEAAWAGTDFQCFRDGEALSPWPSGSIPWGPKPAVSRNRTVEYILRNPAYIESCGGLDPPGFYQREHHPLGAQHEPLISQELWDAVQARMAPGQSAAQIPRPAPSENRDGVTGLVRCASCATLIFSKPHYWKCNNSRPGAAARPLSTSRMKS